jgi:transcriptional regulator with XRE-family HTH domain
MAFIHVPTIAKRSSESGYELSVDTAMGIRVLRVRSGLTREQLAAKLGKAPELIGQWETDTSEPTAADLVQLSRSLRVLSLLPGPPTIAP